jgi:hypothetical protein
MPDMIADELAIRGLTARFDHLIDQGRNEEAAANFVEDGVYEMPGRRLEGRQAIVAFHADHKLGAPADIGFGVTGRMGSGVHATTNNVITIEGDEATQLSYMMTFRQVPRDVVAGGLIVITARLEDRLARTGAGWLFQSRVMTILQTNAGQGAAMEQIVGQADK